MKEQSPPPFPLPQVRPPTLPKQEHFPYGANDPFGHGSLSEHHRTYPVQTIPMASVGACQFCGGPILLGVQKCRHCGEFLSDPPHSNGLAGCLGFFLGPVGLWYKGHWAAGFAWLTMGILAILGTGGLGILLAPFFWVGMGLHAYLAKAKR